MISTLQICMHKDNICFMYICVYIYICVCDIFFAIACQIKMINISVFISETCFIVVPHDVDKLEELRRLFLNWPKLPRYVLLPLLLHIWKAGWWQRKLYCWSDQHRSWSWSWTLLFSCFQVVIPCFAAPQIRVIPVITCAFCFEHLFFTVVSNHFRSGGSEGDQDEAGSEWPLQALFAELGSLAMEVTSKIAWDNLGKGAGNYGKTMKNYSISRTWWVFMSN